MNIGKALKQARSQKGISQTELSARVNISQTSLSQMEKGVKKPSAKNLAKILESLDIPEPIFYLYAIEESDVPDEKKETFKMMYPAIEDLMKKLFSK